MLTETRREGFPYWLSGTCLLEGCRKADWRDHGPEVPLVGVLSCVGGGGGKVGERFKWSRV